MLLYYSVSLYNKILTKYGVTRTDFIFTPVKIAEKFQQDSSWYNWDFDNLILIQWNNFTILINIVYNIYALSTAQYFIEVTEEEIVKPAESTLPFVTVLSTVLIPTVSTAFYRYYRTNK